MTEAGACACHDCVKAFSDSELNKHVIDYLEWLCEVKLDEKDYQLSGVKWCLYHELCKTGAKGGIIADEMGLGKTVLMLACIRVNMLDHTLIILPNALCTQWMTVMETLIGIKPLYVTSGNISKMTVDVIHGHHVVITTYGMFHHDVFDEISWSRVIYDEAHHLRNEGTKRYKSATSIKSDVTWCLTGTPINNSIDDVISLCSVIGVPYNCVKSHFMRRTRKSVGICLPPLVINEQTVEWNNDCIRKTTQVHSVAGLGTVNDIHDDIRNITKSRLAAYVRARQICILPRMIDRAILSSQSDITMSMPILRRSHPKITCIIDQIVRNRNNGKLKMIFCHFRDEIDAFQSLLSRHGFTTSVMDGRTPKSDREHMSNNFVSMTDFKTVCKKWYKNQYVYKLLLPFLCNDILIVQIKTASEGLNLQHISELYFTTPHWNPAVDDQSICRAYRIGQTETVQVYKYYMADSNTMQSMDNYCKEMQNDKRGLCRELYSR